MPTRFLRFFVLVAFALALPVGAHHVADGQAESFAAAGIEQTLTGAVEELAVVDKVHGTTQRYPILRQGNGSRVALRGDAIDALKAGAQVSVTGAQTGVAFTVTRVEAINLGAKTAQATSTGAVQVDGQFMVAHADYFDVGTSKFTYHVIDAKGSMTEVAMSFLPSPLASGMQVSVSGTLEADGQSLVPQSITIEGIPDAPLASTTSYLVLPIKFPTNAAAPWTYGADPFTPATLNTSVFGSLPVKSAKEYYKEVSYGQQQLSGIVADNGSGGFLKATVAKPATCDINAIAAAAESAATARGYNVASYTGILYVFNNVTNATGGDLCGWAGLAYVGYARAYANNTPALWVIGHELGHNFGLLHAGSLRCTGAPIGCGAAGTVAEYGDPFSAMGNSSNVGHFNAAQKSILNWIPGSSVKTHAGGTVTYTLSPIETGGQSVYAVKIPTSMANRTYWIEYRQPTGVFDAFNVPPNYPNSGAQIRVEYPFEKSSGSDDTQILDMTPATGSFGDAALLAGAPAFVDAATNVSINVLSATPGATGQLTVQVSTASGNPTTTTLTSSLNPSNPGQSVVFTATVTGISPTGTVIFTNGGTTITGCGAVALAGSGNARTAACSTSTLAAGTRSIVATYSGDAANFGSASAVLSQVVKSATTTTLASSANPSAVGASVTFTASVTGIAPTGTVNFTNGGTSITGCSAVAVAGSGNTRTAACSTSSLAAGTRSIVAAYGGDAGNVASTSATLSQVVNSAGPAPTTTSLASSANPSLSGASVTFTATVAGSAPTGTVAFTDGGTAISTCSAMALPTGTANPKIAVCSTSSLSAGTHNIVATYAGDAANNGSTSATWSQTVNKTPSNTSLSSSPNPSLAVGTPVTVTAAVTPLAGGGTPTGIATFKDGTTTIGSGALNAGGVATLVTSTLTAGTHSITAAYGGNAAFQPSTSTAVIQVISVDPTCIGNSATNANLVEHYYATILRRPSDAGGKAFWMSEADRLCALGADPKETFYLLVNLFFNSPEYVAFNRDDNGFVTDLYSAVLGRLPDAGGLNNWLGQLSSGMPRDNVMSSFLFSLEFAATMNAAFPGQRTRAETYLVLNLYGGLLRRLAETGGYTYWDSQFRAAQCNASPASAVQATIGTVSSQFLASAEYVARATTNSQYVDDLYYALLQRGAEPAGYNYWVSQLNSSTQTRAQVRQQFLLSPEMTAQSAAIAAQGCLP